MSEKAGFDLMLKLRFLVARFANWFCGPEVLFWMNPQEWEEYISVGEPYEAEEE